MFHRPVLIFPKKFDPIRESVSRSSIKLESNPEIATEKKNIAGIDIGRIGNYLN